MHFFRLGLIIIVLSLALFPCLGQNNYAVGFNGSNQYVSISNSASLNFGNGSITLGLYFKINTVSHSQQVPLIGNLITASAATIGIYIQGTDPGELDGHINFFYRTAMSQESNLKSTIRVDDNMWHSVFAVKDASVGKLFLYIDGSLDISMNVPIGSNDSGQGFVMFGNHLGRYIAGKADHLTIWNRALSESEVTQFSECPIPNEENGLVAFLTFEEGNGSTTDDQTSFNNDGLLVNSVPIITDVPVLVQDNDNDGICNALDSCSEFPGQIGDTCDDGNPNTIGDFINENCECDFAEAIPTLSQWGMIILSLCLFIIVTVSMRFRVTLPN